MASGLVQVSNYVFYSGCGGTSVVELSDSLLFTNWKLYSKKLLPSDTTETLLCRREVRQSGSLILNTLQIEGDLELRQVGVGGVHQIKTQLID